MNKMNKKGFTLIEMLVVIAIIAVLVAIIVPTVSSSTMKAKGAADAANLRSIAAEAAIDYLEDTDLDQTYKMTAKSITGATETTIVFYKDANGNLIPSYGVAVGGKAKSIDYFVHVAETGEEDAKKTTPVTVSTKITPASSKPAAPKEEQTKEN